VATIATVVTTWTMMTTGEKQDNNHQDHDGGDDPRDFHPAWCAGVGRNFRHVRVLGRGFLVEGDRDGEVYET
jgi:hypothetical protein